MKKSLLQRLTPHALAIGIFLAISCIYCLPALKGLVVNQYDMLGTLGAQQQSIEYKEKHGHLPLWTNSVFSGMPAYQILIGAKYNVTLTWFHYLFTLGLPSPASLFFLCCISFYILCMAMRLKPWIGVFGALAYAFCSYNPILVETGHVTKLAAMGYAPAVLAGIIWLAQRKYYLGFAATLLFGTLMINQNHVQITYYVFLIIACMGIAYAVYTIKRKEIKHLLLTGSLTAVALAIGMFSFSVILLPMNEYAKETMRGGRSELTAEKEATPDGNPSAKEDKNKSKGGLDKDYAFQWSYGIGETSTLAVASSRGGGSSMAELGEENHTIEALQENRLPSQAANYIYGRLSPYWGDQPFTSGPVYFGAIVCLLFIAGLVFVRGWHLGWIVAATVLGIVLAWGRHFPTVNYFLFDYLPYYNKFRAPAMALVIPQITMVLLACMSLQTMFYGNLAKPELLKKLKWSGIGAGILVLLLAYDYFTGDFKSERDKQLAPMLAQMMGQGTPNDQAIQQANSIAAPLNSALVKDRQSLYSSDFIRTLVFMILAAAIVVLVVSQKFKAQYGIIALAALSFIDLIQVDRRYLKTENYVEKDEYLSFFTPTQADLQIKQDTGYFRVLDEARGALSDDARASYFHNSIGGYHPAKLALYDDLLNRQIRRYNMQVLNMLNTKYFIVSNPQNGQPVAQINPGALGAAWLVKTIKYVNNADEEMAALNTFSPADTVIIDKREQAKIPFAPQYDSTASIKLVKNDNDIITYQFNAPTNQFVVFSEIYYPYGWKAYVDDKEQPIARVNYTLRGMAIPAGNHTIVFKFEPATYEKANMLGLIIGIISFVLLGLSLWQAFKRKEIDIDSDNQSVA